MLQVTTQKPYFAEVASSVENIRILISDEPLFSGLLFDFFLELGAEVRIASNETEFLLALEAFNPTLLFVDSNLLDQMILNQGSHLDENPLIFLILNDSNEKAPNFIVKKNLSGIVYRIDFSEVALTLQVKLALENKKLHRDQNEQEKKLRLVGEQLKKSQLDLQNLLKMKTKFINELSSSLHLPLNQLVQFAHIGLERMHRKQFTHAGHYLAEVKMITEEVVTCIQELKEISLLKSGENCFHLEEIDAMELLKGIKRQFEPIAESRGMILSLQNQIDYPYIKGDYNHLTKVLRNLLKILLKSLPENSEIKIRTRKNGSQFEIIIDNVSALFEGQIISEVFNVFSIPNQRNKKKTMDFGFSVCKELMLGQNGDIYLAEDENTKDLQFVINLPLISDFFEKLTS
jgi:signal transduction histidine kinase